MLLVIMKILLTFFVLFLSFNVYSRTWGYTEFHMSNLIALNYEIINVNTRESKKYDNYYIYYTLVKKNKPTYLCIVSFEGGTDGIEISPQLTTCYEEKNVNS